MNKIYLSWIEFGLMIKDLTNRIKKSRFKFDGVYGIPRGGIILAICLSHSLKLPLLLDNRTPETLIVDDISDTGETLKFYKDSKKTACLYKTLWTKVVPDWNCEMKLNKNDWIVFPWEYQDEQN